MPARDKKKVVKELELAAAMDLHSRNTRLDFFSKQQWMMRKSFIYSV
jgi:hypothetical protein